MTKYLSSACLGGLRHGQKCVDHYGEGYCSCSCHLPGSEEPYFDTLTTSSLTTEALREEPAEAYEAPANHSFAEIAAEVAELQSGRVIRRRRL